MIGDPFFEITLILDRMYNRSKGSCLYSIFLVNFFNNYKFICRRKINMFLKSKKYLLYSLYFYIESLNHSLKLNNGFSNLYITRIEYIFNLIEEFNEN
jgi:hypothetical protein